MKVFQIIGELKWHIGQLFKPQLNQMSLCKPRNLATRVLFFSGSKHLFGATYLRCAQLAEVFSKLVQVELVTSLDDACETDIVIAAKGSLPSLEGALRRSRFKNLRVLYDPVDELINPTSLQLGISGIIACSFKQYVWLRGRLKLPVYCILHHVDYRIERAPVVQPLLRIGYVGSLQNAYWEGNVGEHVQHVDTGNSGDASWIGELGKFSIHYCIRRKREKSNSFKPATKIYLAACLGVPVITTRDESDAEHLLPPDYPYFCEKRTEREVAHVIQLVKSTHSGPVFAKATADVLALRGWDFDEQLNQVKYLLNVV